jgi:hypothetical protein
LLKSSQKEILITNRKELCTTNRETETKGDDVAKIGRIGIFAIGIKKEGYDSREKTPSYGPRVFIKALAVYRLI